MNNTKYLAGISIVGLVLILGLTMNVSAIPYISIGDTTHNLTVVPGQDADITLPIMVKNASDSPVKGLQFNVTFNCSMINITNITEVDIVNVPSTNAVKTILYNELCNSSPIQTDLLQIGVCAYMKANFTQNNTERVNASVLFAGVRNLGNGNCVLRIAFASYNKLDGNVTIGKIKMHVKGMPNYFNNTNVTLPMNITVEKMGANSSAQINVNDSNIQSQARLNGLIKACRGDANRDGNVSTEDGALIYRSQLNSEWFQSLYINLTDISDCLDINGDGIVNTEDGALIYRSQLNSEWFQSLYVNISSY